MFDVRANKNWAPRDIDYFRQMSDLALQAGASVDDCESSDMIRPPMPWGMLHSLIDYAITDEDVIFSDAMALKFKLFVAALVDVGFSIEYREFSGQTPFLHAARHHESSSRTVLQILLEHGADPTAKDDRGRGALHLAIKHFWRLVSDDGDTSESDDSTDEASPEEYPGEVVVRLKPSELCQLLQDRLLFLLQVGCDPEAKDNNGLTVTDYAERHGLSGAWDRALRKFKAEQQETKT